MNSIQVGIIILGIITLAYMVYWLKKNFFDELLFGSADDQSRTMTKCVTFQCPPCTPAKCPPCPAPSRCPPCPRPRCKPCRKKCCVPCDDP